MCRNVKIKLTYLKVRLSLLFVRSLRTMRGRFRRFLVGVVPPLGNGQKLSGGRATMFGGRALIF